MRMEELLSAADEMEEEAKGRRNKSSPSGRKRDASALSESRDNDKDKENKEKNDSESNALSPVREASQRCKTPNCVVCLKGPPAHFSKGTPIWAQILHLVLFALTESAKVSVVGSPKMKMKRYFHLRDDIYEYISIHWDVICRRERIKNWRHTIGMTLSHYQNLFQNGYHIYQNTGYWSMKDNVPNPYHMDAPITEGSPVSKKKKYSNTKKSDDKEKDASIPYTSDFVISNSGSSNFEQRAGSPQSSNKNNNNTQVSPMALPPINTSIIPSSAHPPLPSPSHILAATPIGENANRPAPAVRFEAMKGEIERFKREMSGLQLEIDSLQEQLQVKKAEEQLLKYLQQGIADFRDRIKQRIEMLRAEMLNNQSEHQKHLHNMSAEVTQLREMGAGLRNAFQFQFSRLSTMGVVGSDQPSLHSPSLPASIPPGLSV